MMQQISLFDFPENERFKPGMYVESYGPAIPHIMRPGFIGKCVVYDCSTVSHKWFIVGRLEKYVWNDDNKCWRSIIYIGQKQRSLIDHMWGREIYKPEPWDFEKRRMKKEIKNEF